MIVWGTLVLILCSHKCTPDSGFGVPTRQTAMVTWYLVPVPGTSLLPISTSYSSPSYTQPYLQDVAKSPCWGTTPVRPPASGLGGLLVSHHQFDHTSYSPDLNENVVGGDESRIEAELQELGGRMVGSILDF